MRILLDTHCLLWSQSKLSQFNRSALSRLKNLTNDLFISSATVWEISIKHKQGRLVLPVPLELLLEEWIREGFNLLPISARHALQAGALEYYSTHKDPFDRMLIAQAREESLALLTADENFYLYPGVELIWAVHGKPPRQPKRK